MVTPQGHTGGAGQGGRRRTPPAERRVRLPIGWCVLRATEAGLVGIELPPSGSEDTEPTGPVAAGGGRAEAVLDAAEAQLQAHFQGDRRTFDLPLDLSGLPDFSRRVLAECARIPYGEVASYGELARRVGRPGAARAVGQAMARNPLPLVVPCHRVVGSDGGLTGFGGGLDLKRHLLRLEEGLPTAGANSEE